MRIQHTLMVPIHGTCAKKTRKMRSGVNMLPFRYRTKESKLKKKRTKGDFGKALLVKGSVTNGADDLLVRVTDGWVGR
jgi:hypothetical protein